ncbi:protein nessun dorma [Venturia canescens]|uniref:protein nessun dorma n=1 Tax=Venturia canescens TaxID=32260 RepID=UPI001C9C6616|nr:protein nessun dorma [Venturia canescens]
MEIYTFDKSLQERLVEYTEILSHQGEDVVPASRIKSEWSFHVELVIEPVGWRALWKIPRLTCQDFEIHYPTIVVVEVLQVDFGELSALVKIVAVQDDEIHLPEKCDVPLAELYPTIAQENKVLDIYGTANCVEQLRFFYNYLWMPWDVDDDDNADWIVTHLEPRIRLFFDMKRGLVDKETCDLVRTLVREGKDIRARIERLEADITENDDDDDDDSELNEGNACSLMKLHFRIEQIKSEMEVLENPAMRDLIRRNGRATNSENKRRLSRGRKKEAFFVWHGASPQETLDSMKKAKQFMNDDTFLKVTGCLKEALDSSESDDIIVVGDGEHRIRGAGGLEEGGTLRGIGSMESTIVRSEESESGPSLFDFSGGEILLENVVLDLNELQAAVLVRRGTVQIVGCKIFVSNKSSVKLGVVVLPGGKLVAENTIFSGLGTAVSVHPGGQAVLEKCKFERCVEGIQMHDEAYLTATKCNFSGFKEYGIRMETEKYLECCDGKTGSQELLSRIKETTILDCTFENNGKGDVALRPRLASALSTKQDSAIETKIS